MSEIYINKNYAEVINILNKSNYNHIFLLYDTITYRYCKPKLNTLLTNLNIKQTEIIIADGEKSKNINTLQSIISILNNHNANRNTLLINIGGGVITDLGGFCAAIYKRGIDYINIPTTLMGMIDASIGGKTAINFENIKNSIGNFKSPVFTIINQIFLKTLCTKHINNGFFEIIKYALISDNNIWKNIINKTHTPLNISAELIHQCINIKKNYISNDLYDKGNRQMLNFGHTIGHAIESYSLKTPTPLLHGEAIAFGMICESYISYLYKKIRFEDFLIIKKVINEQMQFTDIQLNIDKIISYIYNDKKNINSNVSCIILKKIGNPIIKNNCKREFIIKALQKISS